MEIPYKSRDLRWEVPKWLQNFESAPLWPLRYLSTIVMHKCASQLWSLMRRGSMSLLIESTSHTPPEDRQARLSGAGCGYSRHRRDISPWCILYIFDFLELGKRSPPLFRVLKSTHGTYYNTFKIKFQVLFLKIFSSFIKFICAFSTSATLSFDP